MTACEKCGGGGKSHQMSEAHPEDPCICTQCNGTRKERRIRLERRRNQRCPIYVCGYPIAPFPDKRVGHFYHIYQPDGLKIEIEHKFLDRRILKQRRK